MIDSETITLLAKIVLFDKEMTVTSNLTGAKYPAYEHGEANSGPTTLTLK